MTCGTLLLLLRSIRNRWSAGSVPQGMNYRCACPSSQCGRSSVLFYSFKDGTADAPGEYMADWIARQMQEMGYIGIALLMFLENLFPPIPSEVIMPMAGMAVANGDLNMAGVIGAGTAGTLAGGRFWFGVSRGGGMGQRESGVEGEGV